LNSTFSSPCSISFNGEVGRSGAGCSLIAIQPPT
jgi:hypothetical protein